jgi:hypothetical protein
MDPHDEHTASPQVQIVWLLTELKVEGEDDMVPITMPVPIMEGKRLETLRGLYAQDARMIEARIRALYGPTWLAGRQWSIYGDRIITQTQARALFPDDPFSPGWVFGLPDKREDDQNHG